MPESWGIQPAGGEERRALKACGGLLSTPWGKHPVEVCDGNDMIICFIEHYKAMGHPYLPNHWLQARGESMAPALLSLASQLPTMARDRS